MKHKLLILPVILMSTSIIGCKWFERDEVSPVYLENWLSSLKTPEEDPNAPMFWIKEGEKSIVAQYDYELKVSEIIRSKSTYAAAKKVNSAQQQSDNYVMYQITASLSRLNHCTINVYDNGYITTSACGDGWGAPKDQYYLYNIGEDSAKYIIDKTKERYNEIKEIQDREYEAAKEVASFTNFFKAVEESSEIPTVHYNETRGVGYEYNTFDKQDEDLSILADLKEIEYEYIEEFKSDYVPMISYYIGDNPDMVLQIYYVAEQSDYDVAAIKSKSNSVLKHYYQSYYYFYYKIDATKSKTVADKVRAKQGIE